MFKRQRCTELTAVSIIIRNCRSFTDNVLGDPKQCDECGCGFGLRLDGHTNSGTGFSDFGDLQMDTNKMNDIVILLPTYAQTNCAASASQCGRFTTLLDLVDDATIKNIV